MILLDLIAVMIATSLLLYIGLGLYRISCTNKQFVLIALVHASAIWAIRLSSLAIIWQTIFGIAIFILATKYYLKKSWFVSLVAIFTTYLISLISDSLVVIIIRYLGISFSDINSTRGFLFYLIGFSAKIPQAIIAFLIYYKELYLADLNKN